MFKRNLKGTKHCLAHINEVYFVFKKYIIEKDITDEKEYLKLLLAQYLASDAIIDKDSIQEAKQYIKDYNAREAYRAMYKL